MRLPQQVVEWSVCAVEAWYSSLLHTIRQPDLWHEPPPLAQPPTCSAAALTGVVEPVVCVGVYGSKQNAAQPMCDRKAAILARGLDRGEDRM